MSQPPPDRTAWFAAHVQPHEALLRGWLAARFPELLDHDDVVQEGFLRMLRLPDVARIDNPKAFLFTTARNLALNQLRHQRVVRQCTLGEIEASTVLDERTDTPECVARLHEMDLLTEALHTLPDRCRQVFVLRRLRGLSQKATAAQLGISEKTVENQSIRALRKCAAFFRERERRAEHARQLHPRMSLPVPSLNPRVRHA